MQDQRFLHLPSAADHSNNFIWPRLCSHSGRTWEDGSAGGLQTGLGQADLAARSWRDPAAPAGSVPQQLGAGMASRSCRLAAPGKARSGRWHHFVPLPGVSRGSFLPVFHRQPQPSAFNFADDWRVFFYLFLFLFNLFIYYKHGPNLKSLSEMSSLEKTALPRLFKVQINQHLYLLLLKEKLSHLIKCHLNYKLCKEHKQARKNQK